MNEKELKKYFENLDRSLFLRDELKSCAHIDTPLPIGHEQTISQPSLVYKMTRILSPDKNSKVLEIGTGSGYQTAFLAEFSDHVYTVEVIEELSKQAKERLLSLGYKNISYKVSDGSLGWEEEAPFDRIIVTAAAGTRPTELIKQLDKNGRMIVPVGPSLVQDLLVISKDEDGNIKEESVGKVRFVELVGEYGWDVEI